MNLYNNVPSQYRVSTDLKRYSKLSLITAVLVLAIYTQSAYGLVPGNNISDNSGSSGGVLRGPEVAAFGTHVFVAYADTTVGSSQILVSSSNDGVDFNTVNASSPIRVSVDPKIVTPDGTNVFVVWRDVTENQIFFSKSGDSGEHFDTPINVSNAVGTTNPQIAVSGSNDIYLVWQDSSTGAIRFSNSTDGGATFGVPIDVASIAGVSQNPQIAVAGLNDIYVSWLNGNDIAFARSTDHGAHFNPTLSGAPVQVSSTTLSSPNIKMAISGTDNVYMIWQDQTSPTNTEIFFSNSTDGGTIFGSPVLVSNSDGISQNAQIAVNGPDNINIVWQDDLGTGPHRIMFARSTDHGAHFNPTLSGAPVQVSGSSDQSATSPRLELKGSDNIYVVWQQFPPSNLLDSEVWFSASPDGGSSFGCPLNLSSNTGNSKIPQLAISETGILYVTWQDNIDAGNPNTEILVQSNLDSSSAGVTINPLDDPNPKWGISFDVSGGVQNPAVGDQIVVDWGDGSPIDTVPISACSWGPVSHSYSSTGPVPLTAKLVAGEGGSEKASQQLGIDVQKHLTQTFLHFIPSVKNGTTVTVTGNLTDIDASPHTGVGGRSVIFDGTGSGDLSTATTSDDGSGSFSASGSAPIEIGDGWTVDALFDGSADSLYNPSPASNIVEYDTAPKDSMEFDMHAGTNSPVPIPNSTTGLGFDAAATFENVLLPGKLFVSECSSPSSDSYEELGMCLSIYPGAQLADGSGANITMSFVGKSDPTGKGFADIDMYHQDMVINSTSDITKSRNLSSGNVTGFTTDFSNFFAAIALHAGGPEGSHRSQLYFGDGNLIVLRNVLDNDVPTVTGSFDKSSYTAEDTPVLTISDPDGDVDPTAIDVIQAQITNSSNSEGIQSSIFVTLGETAANTHVFRGSFSLTTTEGGTNDHGDILQVGTTDSLFVHYLSPARIQATVDGVTGAGKADISDIVVDSTSLCFKSFGSGVDLSFVDANLAENAKMRVQISYKNFEQYLAEGEIPESLHMYYTSDLNINWVDITVNVDTSTKSVIGEINATTLSSTGQLMTPGSISLGFDTGCGGGAGGGFGRPGAGLVVDFIAPFVPPSPPPSGGGSSGSSSHGGGGASGRTAVDLSQTHDAAYFEENPLAKFSTDAVAIVTADGASSNSEPVHSGDEVTIQSTISNHQSGVPQPYAWIVQVVDKNGATVSLEMQEGLLDPGRSATLSILWTAEDEPGMYTIHIFTWDAIGDNPSPLSEAHVRSLQVQGT